MVNSLKTATSRLVRKEFINYLGKFYWKPVFYNRRYYLIRCGGAPLEIIKDHLDQQGHCVKPLLGSGGPFTT